MIVAVSQAKSRLSDLIDRALADETVVITRNGKPVIELRPVETAAGKDVVARIRAIRDRIREGNAGKGPLLKPGQRYRDLAHERHESP